MSRYNAAMTEDAIDRIITLSQQQRPDLDHRATAVVGRLLRLAQQVEDSLAKRLSQHHLNIGSYRLLAALRRAGEPFEMHPKTLQASLLVTSGGMSNLLTKIENEGWIERFPDPLDRRGVIVRLSATGLRKIDDAMATYTRAENQLISHMSEAERQLLQDLLKKWLGLRDG